MLTSIAPSQVKGLVVVSRSAAGVVYPGYHPGHTQHVGPFDLGRKIGPAMYAVVGRTSWAYPKWTRESLV